MPSRPTRLLVTGLAALALFVLSVLPFVRTVSYGIVNYDDIGYVSCAADPEINVFSDVSQAIWMPLTWLSYRLDYFRNYMDMSKYNFEDHAAQTHHYFTVHDAHSDEYFWFGLPYFDNRHRSFPGYLHIDCGKADATGMMIRTVPQKLLTEQCAMDGNWITVDTDLMPLLREAFATAQTQGVLKGVNFDEMRLTSANFGFEMFAEYNAAFELKDVQVTAILKD